MTDYKELAKKNRFVAAVEEIHAISMNRHPINTTGDVVDAGVALDMYVAAHRINRVESNDEYHEFRGIMRGVSYQLEKVIAELNE